MGPARSSPADPSRARRAARSQQDNRSAGRLQPPAGRGSGVATWLLALVLLAALATVLGKSGVLSRAGTTLASDQTPACPGAVNRWADQRLALIRAQLLKQEGAYSIGPNPNPIAGAMNWIDNRIVERRLDEQRQQIRSSLLASSRCLVEFQP